MDSPKITHISLCSGYGGIDLGLKGVFGENVRTVAYAEIEAFAVECLLARMGGGQLDPAPIWPNLKTFPWGAFSDRVDILSGGYPCQPFSAAGKRLGTDDPRHLWPFIADGIRIMRPKLCFFENVEGHISLGLRAVIEELGSLGYKTTWGIFSAREVGAPHQRKRVFILAERSGERSATRFSRQIEGQEGIAGVFDNCGDVAWPSRPRELANDTGERLSLSNGQRNEPAGQRDAEFKCRSHIAWPSRPGEPQHEWEPPRVVGNATQLQRDGSNYLAGISQCAGTVSESRDAGGEGVGNAESQRSSTQRAKHEGLGGELCAASASGESIVGNADCGRQSFSFDSRSSSETISRGESIIEQTECGQTESTLGRDVDGPAGGLDYAKLCIASDNRTDELRLLGNGVVPATATRAFLTLIKQLNE
jgi:site-specific DNA-cytosine methylase